MAPPNDPISVSKPSKPEISQAAKDNPPPYKNPLTSYDFGATVGIGHSYQNDTKGTDAYALQFEAGPGIKWPMDKTFYGQWNLLYRTTHLSQPLLPQVSENHLQHFHALGIGFSWNHHLNETFWFRYGQSVGLLPQQVNDIEKLGYQVQMMGVGLCFKGESMCLDSFFQYHFLPYRSKETQQISKGDIFGGGMQFSVNLENLSRAADTTTSKNSR